MRFLSLTLSLLLAFTLCMPFDLSAAATVAARKSKTASTKAKKTSSAKTAAAKGAKGKGRGAARQPAPEPVRHLEPVQVKDLRYWSNPDYTRIAVALDREVGFEPHLLKPGKEGAAPDRIYIDIPGARLAPGIKDIPIGDGLLKTARIAQYQSDVVRLVLDVEHLRDYKIFPLSEPFRIIVDVKGERQMEISSLPTATIQKLPTAEELYQPPPSAKPSENRTVRPSPVRRIVVDPGHGGKDPGAVGANGTQEKDVVLAMGLRLAERLRKELGIEVLMTRSSDVFIPLEERTAIANKLNADLFISIHANAAINRAAAGLETYYLNLAKTEKAAQLAARENGTSLEKVSVLQAILFDLMANYKLNDSALLAEDVQKSVFKRLSAAYAGSKNLGVKQGPFYVLVGATMPSILVETAFISNAAEEERLRDSAFQEAAAEGILDGVRAYIAGAK